MNSDEKRLEAIEEALKPNEADGGPSGEDILIYVHYSETKLLDSGERIQARQPATYDEPALSTPPPAGETRFTVLFPVNEQRSENRGESREAER